MRIVRYYLMPDYYPAFFMSFFFLDIFAAYPSGGPYAQNPQLTGPGLKTEVALIARYVLVYGIVAGEMTADKRGGAGRIMTFGNCYIATGLVKLIAKS